MAIRQIDTNIWNDEKLDSMSINEKYVWLYLLTCPHSKSCGVFRLPIKYISFETGVSIDECKNHLSLLTQKHLCLYDESTQEIAVFNYPKYNIRNNGKPIIDMLIKELELVKSKTLIKAVALSICDYINKTIDEKKKAMFTGILDLYANSLSDEEKETILGKISNTNNTNTYIKSDTSNESCNDTLNEEEWGNLLSQLGQTKPKPKDDDDLPFYV